MVTKVILPPGLSASKASYKMILNCSLPTLAGTLELPLMAYGISLKTILNLYLVITKNSSKDRSTHYIKQ
jgi:hypothetical protein